MKENKGRNKTTYNIPQSVDKVFPCVMIPINILSGFGVSVIYPLDKNILTEADSDVIDHLVSIVVSAATEDSTTSFSGVTSLILAAVNQPDLSDSNILALVEDTCLFCKVNARKRIDWRKPVRTIILTNTLQRF